MKTLKNYIQGQEAGEIAGKIVNLIIAVCGAVICVIGIYLQFTNNL